MAERGGPVVAIGCEVRIRSIRRPGYEPLPQGLKGDELAERVFTIAPPCDGGLYRLTPRTPLGDALLGHHAGDVVRVIVSAGTVEYQVVSVASTAARRSVPDRADAHAKAGRRSRPRGAGEPEETRSEVGLVGRGISAITSIPRADSAGRGPETGYRRVARWP